MFAILFSGFERVAVIIDKISSSISSAWRVFREGPLRSFFFALILTLTAIYVLVEMACEVLDEALARLERWMISIALLAMVGLSFMDYLRREVELSFELEGGASMSVVLMVWVGFLGASLATRQKKHLAVDATDRILSPKAARVAKRFTALVAAGFCWTFSEHAISLIDNSLQYNSEQDALPLWPLLEAPVNVLGSTLLPSAEPTMMIPYVSAALLAVLVVWIKLLEDRNSALQNSLSVIVSIVLFVGGLSFIAQQWAPEINGERYVFEPYGEVVDEEKVDLDVINSLVADDTGDVEPVPATKLSVNEIQNLVAEDSGEPDGAAPQAKSTSKAADADDLASFLEKSSGGEKFPSWIAQAVIPLSFILMAFRFFAIAISGRFDPPEDDDDVESGAKKSAVAPPTTLVESTGRSGRDLLFVGLFPGLLLGMGSILGLSLGWVIFIAAILLILVGSPLFLVIGIASMACVTLIQDLSAFNMAKDMFEGVKKEELLAIPFFVLAGNLMTKGSIARRLVNVTKAAMGSTPGGLGLSAIMACVIFAAISGSSPVTVIAVGSIMFPMLVKDRYPERYSLGVLTSSGSLGIIIPPSVPMIIYAIMVSQTLIAVGKEYIDPDTGLLPGGLPESALQVSPDHLFIAGVLPGLFIAGVLAIYTLYQTRPTRKDIDIVPVTYEGGYWSNLFGEIRSSILSILLPVLILGGIYGILGPLKFTVTEAAAVAVVYALIVELLFHRELKLKDLPKVLSDSGVMMGGLFLIIVLAIAFNKFLAEQYIPQDAAAWIQSVVTDKWQFLILVNLFLLALGCVMDIISAILIVAPLLAPIALSYGIHPLHFGIMFIVNLELGYLTPPLGINLFVSSTVFNRPVVEVMRGTIPFLFLMIFCLLVIIAFPFLSLALVS